MLPYTETLTLCSITLFFLGIYVADKEQSWLKSIPVWIAYVLVTISIPL